MRAADRLLFLLKTCGPAETLALAKALGVSRQAALQHLERLAADGLVEHADAARGVGRPRRSWALTGKAQARFPDTHAQVTVEVLDAVREEFGAEGLDRLITRRERAVSQAYRQALEGTATLDDKLARLAQARAAEGYMAEWSDLGDGTYLLVENHCPICTAAAACQGFCRSELSLFQDLLAPATVERLDHILQGARRCAYLVVPSGEA